MYFLNTNLLQYSAKHLRYLNFVFQTLKETNNHSKIKNWDSYQMKLLKKKWKWIFTTIESLNILPFIFCYHSQSMFAVLIRHSYFSDVALPWKTASSVDDTSARKRLKDLSADAMLTPMLLQSGKTVRNQLGCWKNARRKKSRTFMSRQYLHIYYIQRKKIPWASVFMHARFDNQPMIWKWAYQYWLLKLT